MYKRYVNSIIIIIIINQGSYIQSSYVQVF